MSDNEEEFCPGCLDEAMETARVECEGACNEESAEEATGRLALSNDYAVRRLVAADAASPAWVLRYLIGDFCDTVVEAVAGNPATPPDILKVLTTHSAEFLRAAVANNVAIGMELLLVLSHDESHYVKTAVALNPTTPFDVLQRLALDQTTCEETREIATSRILQFIT